jgi:outer membrane protein assembly factor BamB
MSYPLIADGRVFVTVKNPSPASGTTLYALNAVNGAVIWSFNLAGSFWWSAACYENGSVFAINNDGLLRSFDGATGNLIWSVQLPGQYFFTAPPTAFNGVIYLSGAGSGGTVYAVSHLYVIVVSSTDQAGNSGSATTTLRIN